MSFNTIFTHRLSGLVAITQYYAMSYSANWSQ